MAQPERSPKEDPNQTNPEINLEPKATPPEDAPPLSPADILSSIDEYQKKLELTWESTKSEYQKRMDDILQDYLKDEPEEPINHPFPENEKRTKNSPDDRVPPFSKTASFKSMLTQAERALQNSERENRLSVVYRGPAVSPLPVRVKKWAKTSLLLSVAGALGAVSFFCFSLFHVAPNNPLPYSHAAGPVIVGNRIYVVDWLRKSLFIHALKRDVPILAVENVPNNFVTGLAVSGAHLWTVDGFGRKIIQHALTPEHQIIREITTPAKSPAGLFWDGRDLWSADTESQTLYRHKGNDPEEILDQFQIPDAKITSFYIRENRVWTVDRDARVVSVFRLQNPLKALGSFDLDPFLEKAVPSGLWVHKSNLWIVTESPTRLLRIPLRKLKKSNPNDF